MSSPPYVGNAVRDGADRRGWLVGHFLGREGGIRTSADVEIKWGIHPAGERRMDMVTGDTRTTVLLLVSGRFEIELDGVAHVLRESGDYAMWGLAWITFGRLTRTR
jgi:hypothetical protein